MNDIDRAILVGTIATMVIILSALGFVGWIIIKLLAFWGVI